MKKLLLIIGLLFLNVSFNGTIENFNGEDKENLFSEKRYFWEKSFNEFNKTSPGLLKRFLYKIINRKN